MRTSSRSSRLPRISRISTRAVFKTEGVALDATSMESGGYPCETSFAGGQVGTQQSFLQKPVVPEVPIKTVRNVLKRSAFSVASSVD